MNKAEYKEYLKSEHWKQLRRQRLEHAGYKCEKCGSAYCLQVHHLRYRNLFDVLLTDLVCVCRYCHEKEHGIVSGFRPIRPDTRQLLAGVFHQPENYKPQPSPAVKKARGMRQKEIQELLKTNRKAGREQLKAFQQEKKSWKRIYH